jgi:tetratricopeptide (TPR) repeat protein
MRRTAIIVTTRAFASLTFAPSAGAQGDKKDDKKDQTQTAPAPATTPSGKHLPQAKTQPEFDAYQAAMSSAGPEATEKAADAFAQKYPDSEIKILPYKQALRLYQNANNTDKTIDLGRKCLTMDGDDPEVLATVAQTLAERTRDTDLDKEQKFAEAQKDAEKALQTVDTNLFVNPGTPQDKIDAFKGLLRSMSYNAMGIVYYARDTKDDYAKAEDYLRKSIDALPSQPDPVTMLRLTIALDKQGKYTDALAEANKVVEMTKEGTPAGDPARREQSRLQKLTADSVK